MKIAILTDVHGNLPALQAALRAIRREDCDAIFHTGDSIGIGPYPAECLDLILNTPRMVPIMGNHDAWFAYGLPDPQPPWMSDGEVKHQQWTHSCIDPSLRTVVGAWPYLIQDIFEGVRVSFLHYGLTESRRNFVQIIRDPAPAELDDLFGNLDSDIVFYGHHHPSSDMVSKARYINPGSLGCHTRPTARFAVLECREKRYNLEVRGVSYDDGILFREFEKRNVPEREFIYRAFFGGRNPLVNDQ
ncbi:MAG: metallophosphoesterase family protein [Gemmatimonadetes bacterium]|nr:metallophosphoesterase family protein [Gemmatimonadota bacterium]